MSLRVEIAGVDEYLRKAEQMSLFGGKAKPKAKTKGTGTKQAGSVIERGPKGGAIIGRDKKGKPIYQHTVKVGGGGKGGKGKAKPKKKAVEAKEQHVAAALGYQAKFRQHQQLGEFSKMPETANKVADAWDKAGNTKAAGLWRKEAESAEQSLQDKKEDAHAKEMAEAKAKIVAAKAAKEAEAVKVKAEADKKKTIEDKLRAEAASDLKEQVEVKGPPKEAKGSWTAQDVLDGKAPYKVGDALSPNHDSMENAYVIDDYPYGRLRTEMRVWVETTKQGQRDVRQTQNPKTGKWNKPHKSTYEDAVVLGLDEKGHVTYKAGASGSYGSAKIIEFLEKYPDHVAKLPSEKQVSLQARAAYYKAKKAGLSDDEAMQASHKVHVSLYIKEDLLGKEKKAKTAAKKAQKEETAKGPSGPAPVITDKLRGQGLIPPSDMADMDIEAVKTHMIGHGLKDWGNYWGASGAYAMLAKAAKEANRPKLATQYKHMSSVYKHALGYSGTGPQAHKALANLKSHVKKHGAGDTADDLQVKKSMEANSMSGIEQLEDFVKSHKYLKRWKNKNGEWEYEYPQEATKGKQGGLFDKPAKKKAIDWDAINKKRQAKVEHEKRPIDWDSGAVKDKDKFRPVKKKAAKEAGKKTKAQAEKGEEGVKLFKLITGTRTLPANVGYSELALKNSPEVKQAYEDGYLVKDGGRLMPSKKADKFLNDKWEKELIPILDKIKNKQAKGVAYNNFSDAEKLNIDRILQAKRFIDKPTYENNDQPYVRITSGGLAMLGLDESKQVREKEKTKKSMEDIDMDALQALENYGKTEDELAKAQDMPAGKPSIGKGAEQGGKVADVGKTSGNNDAGGGQAGAKAPKKDKLSEDDEDENKALKPHKKPIETTKKSILPAGQREQVAHEQAQAVSRLRKGEDDLIIGEGTAEPKAKADPLQKASVMTQGDDALVYVTNSADLAVDELFKSDQFYSNGSPTITAGSLLIHDQKPCPACKQAMAKSLTACPSCGHGAVHMGVLPVSAEVELAKSKGPKLRRAKQEPDLVLLPKTDND